MTKSHYHFRTPNHLARNTVILGTAAGELLALPFLTPFYVRDFVQKLLENPKNKEAVENLPTKEQEEEIRRSLYELKRSNLIIYKKSRQHISLQLTPKGKQYFKKLEGISLRIPPPPQWDGKWRMLLFDIPEKERELRDALRTHLRQLKFFQIQQSVWIHPYECKKEIFLLCQSYNINRYVLLYTITIENDDKLRRYYKLSESTKPL